MEVKKIIDNMFLRSPWYVKFTKYTLVGASGGLVDFLSLIVLIEFIHLPIVLANACSFCLAVTNNYFLNKYWTFKDKTSRFFQQFPTFIAISLVGLVINTILMSIAVHFTVHYLIAKAVIVFIVGAWNFSANKKWTFCK